MCTGNRAFTVSEKDLQNLFSQCGEAASVKILMDRFAKQAKAFADMTMNSEADRAIKALNGNALQGKHIKISQAENRKRPRRRRRY